MAEIVTVEGQEYKKRSPWGVWGLTLITLGIYGLVWYYKINDEARRYLKDNTIRPVMSVLAFIPGGILIVPPFVSIYRTGDRIVKIEDKTGIQKTLEPILGLVLALVSSLYTVYYQSHLNKVWDQALGASMLPPVSTPQMAAPAQAPTPAMPPTPPPPPPPGQEG